MKKIRKITTILFFVLVTLHGNNLNTKYKQMMSNNAYVHEKSDFNESATIQNKKSSNYKLLNELIKIQAVKQDTFESTINFNTRRNSIINEVKNKIKFFAQNGSQEYSAGTVSMKSYDADKERMQLTLKWNDDLKNIFPEIKQLQIISLNISNSEAKKLFGKEVKHYFHIEIAYDDSRLIVKEMMIYDKYKLIKPISKMSLNNTEHSNKTSKSRNGKKQSYIKTEVAKKLNDAKIKNIFHPPKEPLGLYIVDFYNSTSSKNQTYRVYCPTSMVRDISNGKWKKSRTAKQEDKLRYKNQYIIRDVLKRTCK